MLFRSQEAGQDADQKGLMTTFYEGGRDMYFTNNTVHMTGASSVLSIGDAPKVFYNEVWNVGYLQTDGAVVQVMQGEAPGAEIAYNWIHDVIKYGARFDAPINQISFVAPIAIRIAAFS